MLGTRKYVACLLGLLAALGLAACTNVVPKDAQTAPTPSAAVSTRSAQVDRPLRPRPPTITAGTIVASGSFGGRAEGSATVKVADDGGYTVLITITTSVPSGLRVSLGANARVFNCADFSGVNLSLGAVHKQKELQRFSIPRNYAPRAEYDPSFLHAIALTQDASQLVGVNCARHTYATATLNWALPNMRPGLTVEDKGARSGARGLVTSISGKPAQYRVAPQDNFASIAARLNISVDDIFYLNPQRGVGEDPSAKSDEVLNLLPAGR